MKTKVSTKIVILEYWDKISYTSSGSEKKREESISGTSDIDIFEQFYKKK